MAVKFEGKLPGALPSISLPYKVAATRYGEHVAQIMQSLTISDATASTKIKRAEEFSWSLEYILAPDPDTRDELEFLAQLEQDSQIFLVARGFRWRGYSQLTAAPPPVMARLEDRARLICNSKVAAVVPDEPVDLPQVPLHAVRDALADWAQAYPDAHPGLVALAKLAINQLIDDVKR